MPEATPKSPGSPGSPGYKGSPRQNRMCAPQQLRTLESLSHSGFLPGVLSPLFLPPQLSRRSRVLRCQVD